MHKIMNLQSARIARVFLGAALFVGGPAAADQVIPDNLIVQGSTCSGFDCVNNESFGFDTLRLKENNTRIGFDDTSSGSFPANDWAITANDSGAGGASYLAFDDVTGARQPFRVTAGAPTSSLFVSSSGNVGFGTATPLLDLHVNTGDTGAIRLEQNNSGGFTAQTWDVAGNEANFFVRDVTGGSRLPFRIRPGAPTSSIDIAASGNVGVGTASPGAKLEVVKDGVYNAPEDAFAFSVRDESDATQQIYLGYDDALGSRGSGFIQAVDGGDLYTPLLLNPNAGNVGIGTTAPTAQLHTIGTVRFAGVANCAAGIKSDAAGNLSCITSSRRFKTVAGKLSPNVALANVMALRPQVGTYKETPDVPEHWLIAEEAAEVDPAFVGLQNGEPYTVKTQNVVADLIAVVQEQQRRIEELERIIARQ
jgi:hypothetical protein